MRSNTVVVKALFNLLRSGLWESPIQDLNLFPLEKAEWKALFNMAIEQTIDGVVYDGIQYLPQDLYPPRELMLQWVVRISKIEEANTQMNTCIQEQVSFFQKNAIDAILLKGQAIAHFYPNPTHRICGDIDWYFPVPAHSKQIAAQLQAKGLKIEKPTSTSINYHWRKCEVEQHTKLFDVFNPCAQRSLTKKAQHQLQAGENSIEKNKQYSILPPNLNILQVNLHILKHLLAFGIGLRQFCDAAILYKHLHEQYDKLDLYNTYKKIGVLPWVHVLHDLLVRYLGLPLEKLPFPLTKNTSSDWLLEDVLTMGNFGFYDERYSAIGANHAIARKNFIKRYSYTMKHYFPLAPYEVISFPFMHFLERSKFFILG